MRVCRKLFAPLVVILLAGTAWGQVVRTFVASNGLDSNPCTRAAPCRNFLAAVNAVNSEGEVVVLDAGGYGAVVINKSVSLISPQGIHAAIAPTSAPAIDIGAGAGIVVLRGLYLNSKGSLNGIRLQSEDAALHVEQLVISGFREGILQTSSGSLAVSDTTLREAPDDVLSAGLRINTGTASAFATVSHTRFDNTGAGVVVADNGKLSIRDSVFTGTSGILVEGAVSGAEAMIDRCLLTSGSNGVRAGNLGAATINSSRLVRHTGSAVLVISSGTIRISRSVVTGNSIGLNNLGGTLESQQNNTVQNNTSNNTSGSITPIAGT